VGNALVNGIKDQHANHVNGKLESERFPGTGILMIKAARCGYQKASLVTTAQWQTQSSHISSFVVYKNQTIINHE
jgi:hypothetical protein